MDFGMGKQLYADKPPNTCMYAASYYSTGANVWNKVTQFSRPHSYIHEFAHWCEKKRKSSLLNDLHSRVSVLNKLWQFIFQWLVRISGFMTSMKEKHYL